MEETNTLKKALKGTKEVAAEKRAYCIRLPKNVDWPATHGQQLQEAMGSQVEIQIIRSHEDAYHPLSLIFFEGPPQSHFQSEWTFKPNYNAFGFVNSDNDYIYAKSLANGNGSLRKNNSNFHLDNLVLADAAPMFQWNNDVLGETFMSDQVEEAMKWVKSLVALIQPEVVCFCGGVAHSIGMLCFADQYVEVKPDLKTKMNKLLAGGYKLLTIRQSGGYQSSYEELRNKALDSVSLPPGAKLFLLQHPGGDPSMFAQQMMAHLK